VTIMKNANPLRSLCLRFGCPRWKPYLFAIGILGPVEMLLTVTVLGIYFCITRGPRAAMDADVYKEMARAGLEAPPQIELEALRTE